MTFIILIQDPVTEVVEVSGEGPWKTLEEVLEFSTNEVRVTHAIALVLAEIEL